MKQQTKFHCEKRDKRFTKDKRTLKGQDLKSIQIKDPYKSTRNPYWQEALNEHSIVRYETKDSIWHPDFKTRLEFWSNIHSLEWKSTEGSIMRYATRDSVWQLVKYFCPFWRVYRIEEHIKIPLLDMWPKIQFDIWIWKQDKNS